MLLRRKERHLTPKCPFTNSLRHCWL